MHFVWLKIVIYVRYMENESIQQKCLSIPSLQRRLLSLCTRKKWLWGRMIWLARIYQRETYHINRFKISFFSLSLKRLILLDYPWKILSNQMCPESRFFLREQAQPAKKDEQSRSQSPRVPSQRLIARWDPTANSRARELWERAHSAQTHCARAVPAKNCSKNFRNLSLLSQNLRQSLKS